MKKFIIYTNADKDVDLQVTGRVEAYFKSNGAEVSVISNPAENSCNDVDAESMVVVLGGDGTMLQAIRVIDADVPFIGINLGNLGYLNEIEVDNLEEALERLLRDDFYIEKRMLLDASIQYEAGGDDFCGGNQLESGSRKNGFSESGIWALNDIVISRYGRLQICSFAVYVNNTLVNEYLADGIIVSTPTGSTGYNLSAGGPLALPSSDLILLTPICSHSLTQRSIVLSAEDQVRIVINYSKDKNEQQMELSADGNKRIIVRSNDYIDISRSDRHVEIARLGKGSFLSVLKRKMSE